MTNLRFLQGKNIENVRQINPGTIYLDTASNELWYDDPSGENTENHIRLFDELFKNLQLKIFVGTREEYNIAFNQGMIPLNTLVIINNENEEDGAIVLTEESKIIFSGLNPSLSNSGTLTFDISPFLSKDGVLKY